MATASRWHDPPRLRTLEEDGEDERHATWLELFFDLVFVVAIAQLADGLAEDPSLRGFLIFAGLFVAVWWAWVGYTFYADRFDTDDPPHRVLMILGMFMVAVLASVIPDAFHGETASFALAYAGVRIVVVLLNARAWWHLPAARPLLNAYIPAFSLSIAIFLVSTMVMPPYRYYVDSSVVRRTIGTGQTYLYAHLPLLIGLAALGAGIKLAIKATEETGLTDEVSLIIGGGVALFMASIAVMHLVTTYSRRDVDLWLRLGTAVLALALGAVGPDLGIVLLGILAGALAAQVVIELATHESHRHAEGGIEIG